MSRARHRALTLALHPSSRGLGWVAFEGPFSPYDWGNVCSKSSMKNEACMRKIIGLVERLRPETLVLETFERNGSAKRARVTYLCRSVVAWAMEERIDVALYRFSEVQGTFVHLGARTRQDIAEVLARQFWAFRPLLPKKRKPWDSEQRYAALFSAIALIVTHYQRDARNFLDSISPEPSSF